ncbi:MAG: hypothetical protein M1833_006570 [Piccolia ochrophora]|nr:MAG: hypothetical protein M1833_006570 [Piccolia ochrophora]
MSDATSDIPKDEYAEDIMVSSSWTGDDLVTPLIEPCGEPSPPPSTWRPQRYKHTSDDAEPMVKSFVLTKTKLRCYNPSCSSFLDIVDDAVGQLADNNGLRLRQRLRIRAGSRKPAPTRYDDSGMLLLANVDGDSDRELDEREDEWISRGVRMWPDSDDDESYSLLNSTPAAEGADVDGTADERSIVYLAGPLRGHDRAMVLINFDAGIKLGGLRTRETIHSVSPLKSMTLLQPDGPTMACSKKGHLDGVLRFHAQQRMESDDVEKWSREEEAWYTRLGKGMWLL